MKNHWHPKRRYVYRGNNGAVLVPIEGKTQNHAFTALFYVLAMAQK